MRCSLPIIVMMDVRLPYSIWLGNERKVIDWLWLYLGEFICIDLYSGLNGNVCLLFLGFLFMNVNLVIGFGFGWLKMLTFE